jgi:ABC-type multidrug transport system permease subunit
MNRLLDIGHTDVRIFLGNRLSYVWLFVVPLLFIYFMGFANRGPGDPANPRPAVLVENRDTHFLGALFLEELDAQGMRTLPPEQAGEAERGIRIPEHFTARVQSGEGARVGFFEVGAAQSSEGAMIELRLLRAVIAMNSHLLAAATAGGGSPAPDEAAWRAARAAPATVRLDARFAGRKPVPSGYRFSVPGNLVMYVMMNLLVFGGAGVAAQRSSGVLRRLAAQPITRFQMVGGKIYGLLLLGLVQVAVFLVAGRWLFGVPLGANLPGVLAVLLVYSWVAASLGVFLASVVRAADKVAGLCIMVSLLLAALGGCWWPLELAPPALQLVAHLLPSGWAMEALHQLISFGSGWDALGKPLAVLTGFGVAASGLAARCFRV